MPYWKIYIIQYDINTVYIQAPTAEEAAHVLLNGEYPLNLIIGHKIDLDGIVETEIHHEDYAYAVRLKAKNNPVAIFILVNPTPR